MGVCPGRGSGRKRLCLLAGAGQRHHVGTFAHQRKHRAGSRRGGVLSAGGRSDGREPDRAQPDDSMARLVLGLIHAGCAGAVRLLPGAGAVPGYQSGGGRLSSFEPPLLCGGALQQQRYRADGPDPLRPLDVPSADEASGRPSGTAVCVGGSLLCQHEGDRLRPLGAVRPVCAAAAAAPAVRAGAGFGRPGWRRFSDSSDFTLC